MKILSNGSERLMLLSWEGILSWRRRLGEAGLLRGHVAPLLDDGLLDRSGVGSGPGADLLGDIHTLLDRGKLGHQLGHVLSAADLRSLNVAILENRSSADLDSLVEGNLLVLDETALSEVLLALLLLLGVVVGDVGGVAPLVVAMVTLDHVIVLNLLNHLDLVNTSLAVGSGRNCGDIIEAGWVFLDSCLSLTIISGSEVLDRIPGCVISVISMMVMVVMVTLTIGVEGEGVDKRPGVSALLHTPELSAAKDALAANGEDEKQLCIHVVSFDEPAGALRTRTLLRSDSPC